MKFTILINQKAAIDSGLNLDFADLAIFEFLKDFAASAASKKKFEQSTCYYLFSWKLIVKQLPVLNITTRQSIYNRLQKLVDADVIRPHEANQSLGESWYAFGSNYMKLLFEPDKETLQGCNGNLSEPVKNPLHNNGNNNNTNNDNGGDKSPDNLRQRKITFIKSLLDWVVKNGIDPATNKPRYPKLMYVEFVKHWVEKSIKKKKEILRFEAQEFFELGKRLSTWFSNCNDKTLQDYWASEEKIEPLNVLLRPVLDL